jgi:hypothetical protein
VTAGWRAEAPNFRISTRTGGPPHRLREAATTIARLAHHR